MPDLSPPGPLEGGCACGAVRYRLHAWPSDRAVCHCRICRRASGAPMLAFGSVPTAAFELVRGTPQRWESSPFAIRAFCPTCGSQLTMGLKAHPETLDVTLATLDRPELAPPAFHLWTQSRISWAEGEGLPSYPMSRPHTSGA